MTRILIVDDEQAVADGLARIVAGWETFRWEDVQVAYDGFEALERFERCPADIVITDIRMPGLSGLELIAKIVAERPDTKCILLTGYAEFEYAKQAIQLQAVDYLMKPVRMDHLQSTLQQTVAACERTRERTAAYQKAMHALKGHLPELRHQLLYQMLQGIPIARPDLEARLELLELPIAYDRPYHLMIVRLEDEFARYTAYDLWLIEYALYNIVDEILSASFRLWHCKDAYGYHVYVLLPHPEQKQSEPADESGLEAYGMEIQTRIKQYLQGRVSILFSQRELFPNNLTSIYETAVSAMLHKVGNEQELILSLPYGESAAVIAPKALYEPPALIHLLRYGKWEEAKDKLHRILVELHDRWGDSQEHLLEVFFAFSQSFLYIAHNNGKRLTDICNQNIVRTFHSCSFLSVKQLRDWTFKTLDLLIENVDMDVKGSRKLIIQKIHQFVEANLVNDLSLQNIAHHVYLHPSSLSKMYRSETGQNITDYIFRIRMEKAEHLLLHTHDKVKAIAAALGYQNTAYFIKVFREHFGMTPQEYRAARIPSDSRAPQSEQMRR